tara:strand:- start:4553 stop:4717 length:165 start_codon:yes stop_codon:yes gene_type:complete
LTIKLGKSIGEEQIMIKLKEAEYKNAPYNLMNIRAIYFLLYRGIKVEIHSKEFI